MLRLEHPPWRPCEDHAIPEALQQLLQHVHVQADQALLMPRLCHDALREVRHLARPQREREAIDALLCQVHVDVRRGLVERAQKAALHLLDRVYSGHDLLRLRGVNAAVLASDEDGEHELLRLCLQLLHRGRHVLGEPRVVALEVLLQDATTHAVHHVPDVGGLHVVLLQQPAGATMIAEVERLPPRTVGVRLGLGEVVAEVHDHGLNLESLCRPHPAAQVVHGLLPDLGDRPSHCQGVLTEVAEVGDRQAHGERQDRQNGNYCPDQRRPPHGTMGRVCHGAVPSGAVHDALLGVHEIHHERHVPGHAKHDRVPRRPRDQE
mmetsp:Transcript_13356/g.36698  ORF Transcript_13356/g.36698 Transcript_13356/m.36698 type:complete len:321 (+) Transcript_13356:1134-2096(+)